ncbi:hypothetical protein KSP39_PZI002727 [Platanthera zijinensis]|uniref:Agenet domain-containing protein n=1 Tax=Platanthera zijinensis TaxID=2320716 RepID=A0AAP0C0R7_9ASPA
MDNGDLCLPFKAGQEAESKSFDEGFRGAWFRCKIKRAWNLKGVLGHRLEYFDYPDEKVKWVRLFNCSPYQKQEFGLHDKMELMLRPSYPPFYHASELPDKLPESDVLVIVNDTWQVGDLIDWWYDGCFWSGRITHILGNGEVQIKLPDPPVGEGLSYRALCKDLRPSLDWSLKDGWMVPLSGVLTFVMSARRSSTLESSIMNLEEVACRIRWLKGLLKFGFQRSDLIISSWKLLETGEEHLRR